MEAAPAFRRLVVIAVGIRLLMAAWLPVTGDEAYFFVWAKHLDYGYYDHPPMVAWWLWLLQPLGTHEFIMRLPALLVPLLIAYALYRFIEPYDLGKARLLTLLFLFTPVYLLLPITTTDTPLLLFTFASLLVLKHAWRIDSRGWYAVAGVLLGCAFLSKYFAVLLGVGYFAAFVFTVEGRKRWKGLVILLVATSPAVLVNVAWNYYHCWDNILFNLFNRNQGSEFSFEKPLFYLLVNLYLLTPILFYCLFRYWRSLWRRMRESEFLLVAFSACVPLLLLGLVSLRREVGLHWVLAFYPALFLLLGASLQLAQLRTATRFMIGFAGVHLVVVVVVLALPASIWREAKAFDEIVFLKHTDDVAQAVDEIAGDLPLFTTGYTPSAMLAHRLQRDIGVFGPGSRYARQDDMLTDFRKLAGKNLVIMGKHELDPAKYEDYFERVELQPFEIGGARFTALIGHAFDEPAYRQKVLSEIRDRYYDIPAFLPVGRCGFLERYFPDAEVPAN